MLNSRFNSRHRYIARWQVISCTCLLAVLNFAQAQPYPSKPVRIVVGFPPGGAVDILGRALAQQLSQRFNQQFVVDNRGGASSVIGTDIVAKSPPGRVHATGSLWCTRCQPGTVCRKASLQHGTRLCANQFDRREFLHTCSTSEPAG